MNGSELFTFFEQAAQKAGRRSAEARYFQDLQTGLFAFGRTRLYAYLEQADASSGQLELTYPIDPAIGDSEPNGMRVVARNLPV